MVLRCLPLTFIYGWHSDHSDLYHLVASHSLTSQTKKLCKARTMSPGYWSYTASILKLKSCLNVNSHKFYNTAKELESASEMNAANTSEQCFSALPVLGLL